jgi:PUA-domain protein
MPKKLKRYFLKDKEAKTLLDRASRDLKRDLAKIFDKINLEIVEADSDRFYLINDKPVLFETDGKVYPTLMFDEYFTQAPKATVDMGAIPHVCKGANVMAPGIRKFEGKFAKGDIIVVVDEKYGKPIALGEVLCDSVEALNVKQGMVIKTIHFVGDKAWEVAKKITAKA